MVSRRSNNDRAGGKHPSHQPNRDGMSSDHNIFRGDAKVETTPPPATYASPHHRPAPPLPSSATAKTAAELPRPPDVPTYWSFFKELPHEEQLETIRDFGQKVEAQQARPADRIDSLDNDVTDGKAPPSYDDAVIGRGIVDGQVSLIPPGDRVSTGDDEVTTARSTPAVIVGGSDDFTFSRNLPSDGPHSSVARGGMHVITPDRESTAPIMGGLDGGLDTTLPSSQFDLTSTDLAAPCTRLTATDLAASYDTILARRIDDGQLPPIPPGDRITTGGDAVNPVRSIPAAIMGGFDDTTYPRTEHWDEQLSPLVNQTTRGDMHDIVPDREDTTPIMGGIDITSPPPRSWLDDANRKGVPVYVLALERVLQEALSATSNLVQDHALDKPASTLDEFDDWKRLLEMQRRNIADRFDRQLQERGTHQMGHFNSFERRLHDNATDDASCTCARSNVNAASVATVDDDPSITVDDETIIHLLDDLDAAAVRAEPLDDEADLAATDLFVISDGDCTNIERSGPGGDDIFEELPRLFLHTADEVSPLVEHDATTFAIFPDMDVWQQQFDARRRDMMDNNKLATDVESILDSQTLASNVESILDSNTINPAPDVESISESTSNILATNVECISESINNTLATNVECISQPSPTANPVESPSNDFVEPPTNTGASTTTTLVEFPSISTVETPTGTTTVESPSISTVEAPTIHNLVESPDTTPVETSTTSPEPTSVETPTTSPATTAESTSDETPTTSPEPTSVETPTTSPATTAETSPKSPAPSAVEVPISLAKSPTTVETPTSISHVDQRASNIAATHPFRRGLPLQAKPRRKRQRRRSKRPRNSNNTTPSPPTSPTAATTPTSPVANYHHTSSKTAMTANNGHQMDINKPSSTSRYTTPPTDHLDEKPTSKPSPTDQLHEKPTTKPSRSRRRRQRRRRRKRHTNQHQSSQAYNTTLQPSRHHVSLPQLTTTHRRPTTASGHHTNIPQLTTNVTHLYRYECQPQRFFGPPSGHDIILMAMLGIPLSWDAILAKPLAEGTTIVIR